MSPSILVNVRKRAEKDQKLTHFERTGENDNIEEMIREPWLSRTDRFSTYL